MSVLGSTQTFTNRSPQWPSPLLRRIAFLATNDEQDQGWARQEMMNFYFEQTIVVYDSKRYRRSGTKKDVSSSASSDVVFSLDIFQHVLVVACKLDNLGLVES